MYILHIANKNYSSWSLRPWLLLRALNIAFEEVLTPFSVMRRDDYPRFSPSGKVPCLVDGDLVVWDSLAIVEYLAERHSGAWPADAAARAWARCACAEMHSGFAALRNLHGMNVGARVRVAARAPELSADIQRIEALWNEGLRRFGGPFLAGADFGAVDAFFGPVAFRCQSYGVELHGAAAGYLARLLQVPAMREWEAAALAETWRDPQHEAELAESGELIADLRAVPPAPTP